MITQPIIIDIQITNNNIRINKNTKHKNKMWQIHLINLLVFPWIFDTSDGIVLISKFVLDGINLLNIQLNKNEMDQEKTQT